MDRYYKERFHAQRNLIRKIAPLMEVNAIIEKVREELRETAGDILMGEETRKMVDGLWPVYHLGPVSLKGIKDPLPVFSLLRSP